MISFIAIKYPWVIMRFRNFSVPALNFREGLIAAKAFPFSSSVKI